MFTGIVKAVGTIEKVEPGSNETGEEGSALLTVNAGEIIADLKPGDSLAVNGVCLTATGDELWEPGLFIADVMGETLSRTNLGGIRPGSRVNLERCMGVKDRFDGHLVQGHIDGLGIVSDIEDHSSWRTLCIEVPEELSAYLAEKGSIAVSGVSLTVTAVSGPGESPAWFEVGLIPATLKATVLGELRVGDTVNLETDALAKYVHRILATTGRLPAASVTGLAQNQVHHCRRGLDPVTDAVEAIRRGQAVVVLDDEDRENEGDIIFAAEHATSELVGFTVRYTSGVICAPMPSDRADKLGLPPMTVINEDPKSTSYTVSCDAVSVVSTGISSQDRAITLRALASADSTSATLTRPGHVFPLQAVDGGVTERRGHTEAAVQLCQLAGCSGVAAIAELVNDNGTMMRLENLHAFATEHRLPMIAIADLVDYLQDQT